MKRLVALAIVGAVMVAACGSEQAAPAETGAPATDAPSAEASADAEEPQTTDAQTTEAPEVEPSEEPEADAAFPVTIEHKFGETTVEVEPERVVSVGYNEHDFLLALGVVPVGLRDWYGEQPNSVWPWAHDALGGASPEVLPAGDLNFEQIAALDPDLIVGVWSGMTEADYELLEAIAPTVAQPDTYDDYGTPWQEQTMILGEATGRVAEAEAAVAAVDEQFAAVRDSYPEWQGMSASVAFVTESGPGAYASQDTRSRIMADLGFEIPAVNDSGGENSFFLELSAEDITPLDVDVLVWVYDSDEALDGILNQLPTRASLDAYGEGREVFADFLLTGAFSHGSPLSLDYALENLVPEIAAAADGDPSTPVPSAVEVGGAVEGETVVSDAGEGSDTNAAALEGDASTAWATVFDSTVAFDEKAAFLEDADELGDVVVAYEAAGSSFGGISLVPTAVVVDGDTAEVTYDVNFGENTAYSDQVGSLTFTDGVWTVSRDEFCSFMASARVDCS